MSDSVYDTVDAFYESVKDGDCKKLADIIFKFEALFAYQGFEPERFAANFIKKCKARSIDVRQAIGILIGILVHRGTNLEKIKRKSSQSLRQAIDRVSGMVSTAKGESLGRDDITLTRVAAIVPELTARAVHKSNRAVLKGFEDVPNLIKSLNLACVLPSDSNYLNVAKVNMLYCYEFDKLATRKKGPTEHMRQSAFWTATHASPVMKQEDRYALMKELGITAGCVNQFVKNNAARLDAIPTVVMAPAVVKGMSFPELGIGTSLPYRGPVETDLDRAK